MSPGDVDFMIAFLHKRSGLLLTPDKQYLLESRLTPIARAHGCNALPALVALLRLTPPESLMAEVTEAMTTNETSFFRDGKPFEHLRQTILPQLRRNAGIRRTLRIWSTACSAGQEPYSIAILLLEDAAQNPGWNYDILATDLAGKILEKARQGVYSQFEAQRGLPIQMLLKYFTPNPDTSWQAKDELRKMVRFEAHNLIEDSPPQGCFDLILCRNVLIYFDEKTKSAVVGRLCGALQPGGFLCVGSTESIMENDRLVQPEGLRGIYQVTPTPERERQMPKRTTAH